MVHFCTAATGQPDRFTGTFSQRRSQQARTAALSPKGRLEVVKGSGHFIQTDRSEAVIAAVLEAVRATGADTSSCETVIPVR